MDWLGLKRPEEELLCPLPSGTFKIAEDRAESRQAKFAF